MRTVFPIALCEGGKITHLDLATTSLAKVKCDVFPVVVHWDPQWSFSFVDACTRVPGYIDDQGMRVNSFSRVLLFAFRHSAYMQGIPLVLIGKWRWYFNFPPSMIGSPGRGFIAHDFWRCSSALGFPHNSSTVTSVLTHLVRSSDC